jgi:hypothetical protein
MPAVVIEAPVPVGSSFLTQEETIAESAKNRPNN